MHDIPEGVARYDMALIIGGLIDQGCFTLNELKTDYVILIMVSQSVKMYFH